MRPTPGAPVASGRIRPLATLVAIVLGSAGLTLIGIGTWSDRQPVRSVLVAAPTIAAAVEPEQPIGLARSVPVELGIPSLGLATPLVEVGLNPDGTVELPAPSADAPAAWYRNLASPGEVGPAVILGHVDSRRDGPAVFYRLGEVLPGATVSVRRADGSTAVFTVTAVARYPKSAFPSAAVYGPVAEPQLRLVTCGGTFDQARHSYRDNVVVYATFTEAG